MVGDDWPAGKLRDCRGQAHCMHFVWVAGGAGAGTWLHCHPSLCGHWRNAAKLLDVAFACGVSWRALERTGAEDLFVSPLSIVVAAGQTRAQLEQLEYGRRTDF